MSIEKPKIIVVIGPTASGKSELAIELAERFNGEIISADSRQIYRHLNIGTAKVPGAWHNGIFYYKQIPHYLIEEIDPKKIFTAADFRDIASVLINDITDRGRVACVAGGTGFWIDALIGNYVLPNVPKNDVLREQLASQNTDILYSQLRDMDPIRAKSIDAKNRRRLIRAIEIATVLGYVPARATSRQYSTLILGIDIAMDKLKNNIESRARVMIAGGLTKETQALLTRGIARTRICEFGFEYRTALAFLDNIYSKEQLLEQNIAQTIKYAKRQITWFRKNKDIIWVQNKKDAVAYVAKFIL